MLQLGGDAPAEARDAATVILLRARASGFHVYLLRRHTKSGFMGGAHVFPGGKVDLEDGSTEAWSATHGLSTEQAKQRLGEPLPDAAARAFFLAAARETFEEAGVLLGSARPPTDALRTRLNAGERFDALLAEAQLTVELGGLWPLSRWITPTAERRRYDTRFFLAQVPREQGATPDLVETTTGVWLTPAEALAASFRGEIVLPPPTLRTLECLSRFERAEDAFTDAKSRPPPVIAPEIRVVEGVLQIVLPGDAEHGVSERRIEGSTRIACVDGRWTSLTTDS